MHPAPSVILFTVLSGLGFGLLAFLGLGLPQPAPGWAAFLHWGLGYGLAVGGLSASTFHLGHPERALKAFSQWQSSWLSREAWASVAALLLLAPVALSDWLGPETFGGWPRLTGSLGAAMCGVTVFTTSMIYTQLKTVPRWNHWSTPVLFLACHSPLPGNLIPVLSINRFKGPAAGRQGIWTASVSCRRHRVQ
jgi:DMSO reductase anchor subunit